MKIINILLIAFLTSHLSLDAKAAAVSDANVSLVQVGQKDINLPTPNGYYEVYKKYPKAVETLTNLASPQSRILAVWVSDTDLHQIENGKMPLFNNYFVAATTVRDENSDSSQYVFDKVYQQAEASIGKFPNGTLDSVNQIVSKASRNIIKLGDAENMGIHYRNSKAFGFLTIAKVVNSSYPDSGYTAGNAIGVFFIKNTIISAHAVAVYRTPNDLISLKSSSSKWFDLILKHNQ